MTQRCVPRPEPLVVLRLAIFGVMPRARSSARWRRLSYARSASSTAGRNLPYGPTGAMRSTSSSSCVMSLRLAAVTVNASGIPLPAQMT